MLQSCSSLQLFVSAFLLREENCPSTSVPSLFPPSLPLHPFPSLPRPAKRHLVRFEGTKTLLVNVIFLILVRCYNVNSYKIGLSYCTTFHFCLTVTLTCTFTIRAWWYWESQLCLSVCHTRALWLIHRTYQRYFIPYERVILICFRPPNSGCGGVMSLPPEIGDPTDPLLPPLQKLPTSKGYPFSALLHLQI